MKRTDFVHQSDIKRFANPCRSPGWIASFRLPAISHIPRGPWKMYAGTMCLGLCLNQWAHSDGTIKYFRNQNTRTAYREGFMWVRVCACVCVSRFHFNSCYFRNNFRKSSCMYHYSSAPHTNTFKCLVVPFTVPRYYRFGFQSTNTAFSTYNKHMTSFFPKHASVQTSAKTRSCIYRVYVCLHIQCDCVKIKHLKLCTFWM